MSAIMSSRTATTGRFVWRDLMSTDAERARAFYTELFGWSLQSQDMGDFTYEMLVNKGEQFGGLMPLDPSHGIPSHWISYIEVPDVDEACATATRLGGSVPVAPMDIPSVGRFAVIADPQGAHFSPFTPVPMDNESGDVPQEMPPLGGVTWNELMTGDLEGARTFYGEIFGWNFEEMNMMEGPGTYLIGKNGDRMDCGIMGKPEDMPVSLWVIYFHVADLDQSLADVTRLGGQSVSPIIEVPTIGRISWVTDSTGGLFALHEGVK